MHAAWHWCVPDPFISPVVENLPPVLRERFMPWTLNARILRSPSAASRDRRFAAFANTAA
jgi:hypothetical protein